VATTPFQDKDLQQELLGQIVFDKSFVNAVGDSITLDDFRPLSKGQDTFPWITAGIALEFFRKHGIPIEALIGREVEKWARESGARNFLSG
jgi:hypothetical protein